MGTEACDNFDFLTTAEKARLEWIRQARLLFDGEHRHYFLHEGRTEYSYRRVLKANGRTDVLYVPDNMLDLAATQAADLLFGESPLISSDAPIHKDRLKAIGDRSGLQQVLHSCAVDASAEAETFLEGILWDQAAYVQQVDALEVSPIGPVMPDGQHPAYMRRQWTERPATPTTPAAKLLLEQTYRAGSIERHLWVITGGKKEKELALTEWPAYAERIAAGEDLSGTTDRNVCPTGIPWNTLVWIPNRLVRKQAVSDYSKGVITLQDTLNAKTSQLAVILLQHANPKLLLPEEAKGNGPENSQVGVYYMRVGAFEPKYLTWEAQLEAAQADRKFAMSQMLMQLQTSAVLLGMEEGAAAESYDTVRVRAMPAVGKAARRSIFWVEGLRTVMTVASMLEQTIKGNRYDLGEISVKLRDGIPVDGLAQANKLATLRAAGFMPVRQGLTEIYGDDAKVEELMAELKTEAAEATPNILLQTDAAPDQLPVDSSQLPVKTPQGGNMGETPMPQAA